jgi:AraC-like DNA-binding protein
MNDTGYTQADSVIIRINEEMEWRSSLTSYGYVLEARIPFCVLSALQFPNKYVGFDISVIDVNDTLQNKPVVYTWSGADASGRHNPREWGTIALQQLFLPLKILLASSLLFVTLLVAAMLFLILYRKHKDLAYEMLEKKDLSPALKEILVIIDNNIEKPDLGPGFLASAYGCSASTLEKTFRQGLNTTCKNIIALSRIKRAKAYLNEPGVDIKDIAQAVGFTEITAFKNTFKQLAGVSPQEWRKNRLEDAMEENGETRENCGM